MRIAWCVSVLLILTTPCWAGRLNINKTSVDINLSQLADEIEDAIGQRLAMGVSPTRMVIDDFDVLTDAEQQTVLELVNVHQPQTDYTTNAEASLFGRKTAARNKLKAGAPLTDEDLDALGL